MLFRSPVELGSGKIKFAQGIKAGRWVFATGLMGQDFVNGIAPEVLAERMPHAGRPKREREAGRIFDNLDAVLRAASTDRANLVRTDQYYTTVAAVPATVNCVALVILSVALAPLSGPTEVMTAWGGAVVSMTTAGMLLGQIAVIRDNIDFVTLAVIALSLVPVAIEVVRGRRSKG